MKHKLNEERNKHMDSIIEIEETKLPSLYREKLKVMGEILILSKRKAQLWKQIKEIHKEIRNEK